MDLEKIANETDLAGGGIVNVIRFVSLMSIAAGRTVITEADLEAAIRRELIKEGKRQ